MAELVWFSFAGIVFLAPIVFVVIALRKRRRYVWLRLVDEKTKAPIAGAKVFGIRYSATYANVQSMHGGAAFVPTIQGQSHERRNLLGQLDAEGRFQRVVGHREYGAFLIEAPGVTGGVIGVESVADYDRFPNEPYVCTVTHGMIAPPRKRSNLSRGLEPGETVTRREGYTNRYEKPEIHDTVIAYPTLEAAKRHAHGGGLDRYWKVEGVFLSDFQDGWHLEVESVRRAE